MKNSALAVLMVGSVLIASVTAYSMMSYVYNSSKLTIQDSMETISRQEIEAYNNNYLSYKGLQTGSQVKALLTRVTADARVYMEENRIPKVYVSQLNEEDTTPVILDYSYMDDEIFTAFVKDLSEIRNGIQARHTYYIEFSYGDNGLINGITINYDSTDHTSYFD